MSRQKLKKFIYNHLRKMMKKVLMFLSQGFEDLEAVTIIVDVLGWTAVRESLTPIEFHTCGFHDEVVGAFGITIRVDFNILLIKPFDPITPII